MTPVLADFCRHPENLAYARQLIDTACGLHNLDRDMREARVIESQGRVGANRRNPTSKEAHGHERPQREDDSAVLE